MGLKKRPCLCNCHWTHHHPWGTNTERAFQGEGQRVPGEHLGSSAPSWLQKVSICRRTLRPKSPHLFHWGYVTPKPYWLSENNPATPYVCRGEELGEVSNLFRQKNLQYLLTPQASNLPCSKQNQVHGAPELLSHPSSHAFILRRQKDCITFWENKKKKSW